MLKLCAFYSLKMSHVDPE